MGFSGLKRVIRLSKMEVTSMNQMLEECTSLEEIVMSNIDLSKVTSMENMYRGSFKNNNSLTIDMSNIKIPSPESMSQMFYDVYKGRIDWTNIDISNVKNMSYMFGSNDDEVTVQKNVKFMQKINIQKN